MTFQKLNKTTKYTTTAILATLIIVAFSAAPAFATTTNVPAYNTWTYFNVYSGSTYNTNDYYNASPTNGNIWIYAEPLPSAGLPGQDDVRLISSGIALSSGHTITLSSASAKITGTMYVDPVGGTKADINVVAYVSVHSDCSTDDSTSNGITLLNHTITTSSWSTNTTYSPAGTTSYTTSGAQTVYVCGYAQADGVGGFSYSDFGSSGSSNEINDFKITATY